jgi:hypothetical protein
MPANSKKNKYSNYYYSEQTKMANIKFKYVLNACELRQNCCTLSILSCLLASAFPPFL